LGENGGVEPAVSSARLNVVLEKWVLFPRTKRSQVVPVIGLGPTSSANPSTDWLLLRVDQKSIPKQISPLRLRNTPVAVGETVFLIGVSYAEPDVAQKVYSGKVTQRASGGRFRFNISPHVDIRGFSGAPVVDQNGLVVGVTSIWFEPKMDGELWTESGAEDVSPIVNALK
jgi:S1-C subfamily serine protease